MRYVVFFCAVIGALFLVAAFFFAKGSPQEAALAAMACAFAIIPYVIFRTGQLTQAETDRRAFRKALLHRLDNLENSRQSP